ncbi:MAG: hypothetical protein EBY17_19065 [Acidobacteriia bacterium]|nr:hypothetical protein [Terriglobia bacterium]
MSSDGAYTYTVANSATQSLGASNSKVDTFTITSADGTQKDVSFTIHGTNDEAVIGAPTVSSVTEDADVDASGNLTATGTISISDTDAGQNTVSSTAADGNLGTLALSSDGGYTYTVANSATQSLGASDTQVDTFTITSADGTEKVVSFTIQGTNDAAVIGAPSVAEVTQDNTVETLTATGSISIDDIDQGQGTFNVSVVPADDTLGSLALSSNGSYTYTVSNADTQYLGAGETKVETFTVTSADGTEQQVSFTINGTNDAPVISVSPLSSLVQQGQDSVELFTASSTDADAVHLVTYSLGEGAVATEGDTVYFEISPTSGQITLTHAGAAAIAADPTGNWSVEVIATDDQNATSVTTVTIEIQQAVNTEGTAATLPGSVSDWNFKPAYLSDVDADGNDIVVADGFLITRNGNEDISVKIPEGVMSVQFDNAVVGLNNDGVGTITVGEIDPSDDGTHTITIAPDSIGDTNIVLTGGSGNLIIEGAADSDSGSDLGDSGNYRADTIELLSVNSADATFETAPDNQSVTMTLADGTTFVLHEVEVVNFADGETVRIVGAGGYSSVEEAQAAGPGTIHFAAITIDGVAADVSQEDVVTSVSGQLTASSAGGLEIASWSIAGDPDGAYGSIAVDPATGEWTYTLANNSVAVQELADGDTHEETFTVRVEDAHGAAPTIPFWLGEAPGRSRELSWHVAALRERILADSHDVPPFLIDECSLSPAGALEAAAYVRQAADELGALPSQQTIVAERFFDEGGGMQLVLHAPFGSRITRAWGLALRKRFCRTFNFELQAAATDNGLVLSLSDQHSFPLALVFEFLREATVEGVLSQALLDAPMFNARWRWNASRSLAILRFSGGRKTPANIVRMRSEDLLASVFPDQVACAENLTGPPVIPDHPLVRETMQNCLHEAMDLDGLRDILRGFENGTIRTVAIDTARASSFGHEILNANPYAFLDDAPLEERRTRAVELRGKIGSDVTRGAGILDPAAIDLITAETWPDPRDADELHDALLTLVALPPVHAWTPLFTELTATGRATIHVRDGQPFWVATERRTLANDCEATVAGWLDLSGPVTAPGLAKTLAFPAGGVEAALAGLESRGLVLQGWYRHQTGDPEWCHRRILARIHRATLGKLRREIEPVTSADFERFLHQWQHTAPGAQLHGADGTLALIRQLQGYEAPAAVWEPEILARRVAEYEPELLDELCLSGEVMWGRLSPHPAHLDSRVVRPTRVAPVALFLREDAHWLMSPPDDLPETLSHAARDVMEALQREGASFFIDIVRAAHRLPSEVEDGLWELVAGGLVTADGFDNLRALMDPKRRSGQGRQGSRRPRHAGGRWALVRRAAAPIESYQRTEHFARLLLARWGVLFRDLLQREAIAPPWRELVAVLRRLEAAGELRGGRFVAGYTGEQFALPEAVELVRAVRRDPDRYHKVSVAPHDPLNLAGVVLPQELRSQAVLPDAQPLAYTA